MKKIVGFATVVAIALLVLALWPGSTREIDGPNAIASLEAIELGGVEQWVLIRGRDAKSPGRQATKSRAGDSVSTSRLRGMGAPEAGTIPVESLREMGKLGAKMRGRGPRILSVEDATATDGDPSVPVRIYRAVEAPAAVLVYFHGGGWTTGSVDEFDAPMRRLAVATGATIVSVDYRLAPEHPFPAAADDAWTAVRWASAQRGELAEAGAPLFVGGDSAGGNLTATVCMTAKSDPDVDVAGQILIYPAVAGDPNGKWMTAFDSPFLTQAEIAWFYDQYVPDVAKRQDARFAPLLAEDHSGLPPALVVTAEFDLFKAEGKAFAEKLREAGVSVETTEYPGAIHGFFSLGDGTTLARRLADEIAAFVKQSSSKV